MSFKIHKTSGGVIHSGSWMGNEADPKTSKYGYFTPSCGSGVVYAMGTLRNIAGFREAKAGSVVTCKKCLKLAAKLEAERVEAEAVEARRQQAKAAITEPKPSAESPAVDEHAAAVARMRANREAEEEERAAARRARNRTNYAPAPVLMIDAETSPKADEFRPQGERKAADSTPPKPEPFTFEYGATAGILIASALLEKAQAHRKAAKGYRSNAALGTGLKDFYAEQARLADNNAKLLEDAADAIHAPVKAALAEDMGKAIDRAEERPFHRKLQDAIGFKF